MAVLTRPWWSRSMTERMSRTGANVAAYRLRLAETEQELRSGNLEAAAAEALKLELQQRLLQDAAGEESQKAGATAPSSRRGIAVAIAIFLPAFSGVCYYQGGSW